MPPLLATIAAAAVLSTASFLAVILRVSPLTSPEYAVPAFFISMMLTATTCGTLLSYSLHWVIRRAPVSLHTPLRHGILLALMLGALLLFHLWALLTWWIAVMIAGTFVLIGVALEQ